ncbi:hypothetical protein FA048_14655 [Pedobacter polaris]|uniref:SRPBCC domain-containing protein n=1 Tax=Pedobacter polaris TaxID=2571273 RepID=A0A4U1CRJ5_9SPHI|nr:hypothetical protein [Pedobacter polaris]TKC08392.1 hypothetical protein FA048_14655 [Pedobacter polaris]
MENALIPTQKTGSKLDLFSSTVCDSIEEALLFFQVAKNRLIDVNQWDEICNTPSSVFRLINAKGQEIVGLVQEDDYIRINIPGPGTKIGEGYDWVKVESITEKEFSDEEILSITVRPSHHPLRAFSETAHFFWSEATSTFQVKRKGNTVYAEVHGRNEAPNNKTSFFVDNLRNTLVGWGAKMGFSYPQWKGLTEGLVKR